MFVSVAAVLGASTKDNLEVVQQSNSSPKKCLLGCKTSKFSARSDATNFKFEYFSLQNPAFCHLSRIIGQPLKDLIFFNEKLLSVKAGAFFLGMKYEI